MTEYGVETLSAGFKQIDPMPNLRSATVMAQRNVIRGVIEKRVVSREVGEWVGLN